MDSCDVLVVGGGLAGLSCARGLAQAGLETVLVDRKRDLGARVHTTGIFVRRTLEDFALPEACLGPPIRKVVLYSPARRALRLASRHDEFRVGKMSALYRRARAEAEAAGARVWTHCRLEGVRPGRADVDVELVRGGRPAVLRARFVIGADGARSRVARALGMARNRRFLIGAEEVLESVRPGAEPVMHCVLDPDLAPGYLAWVVDDGEEAHVGVAGEPGRFAPLEALARFRAEATRMLPLGDRRIERRGGRIPVGGLLPRISSRHGLLVGDAAGAVSPLTAGGLDPCLRQARLAVEVTRSWLATRDATVLAAYDGPVLRKRFRGRRILRRMLDGVRSRTALELAFIALRAGPVRRVPEHVFFGRGSFPDLSLAALLSSAHAERRTHDRRLSPSVHPGGHRRLDARRSR